MLRKTVKPEIVDLSSEYWSIIFVLLRDFSGSEITSLSRVAPHNADHVTELNLNHNELYTLEGISSYTSLQKVGTKLTKLSVYKHYYFIQLSAHHNHLVDLTNIMCLDKLTHLDLKHNSLTDIAGIQLFYCDIIIALM